MRVRRPGWWPYCEAWTACRSGRPWAAWRTQWAPRWEAAGVARFDRSRPRSGVYAIDSPPLTVSGSLHVGHVLSYTHTDLVARFHRMRGRSVFYPVAWDDNGLPTERRVQAGLRGALRADAAVRPGLPAAVPAGPEAAGAGEPARLHRAVRAARGRGRGRVRGGVAAGRAVGRLVAGLLDDRRAVPAHLAARVPAGPAPRRRVPGRRADAVGRGLPDGGCPGRARRPRGRGCLVRGRLPWSGRPGHDRDHPARAAAGLRRGGCPSRRRAVRGPGRRHRADTAVRCGGAGSRARAGRPGQGHRPGDGVHVRRPHRCDVVAGARAADPAGGWPGRAAAAATRRPGSRGSRTPSSPG